MYRLASGCVMVFLQLPASTYASSVDGSYVQTAKLGMATGSEKIGISVGILSDQVIVGRPPADKMSTGSTYIYQHGGKNWDVIASLVTEQVLQDFGSYEACTSVAIDNDVAVVGEPSENFGQGIAQVYRRTTAGWVSATLKDDAGAIFDNFGCAVSISGGKILVTAPNKNNVGQGFVYSYSGSGWQLESALVPTGAPLFTGVGVSGAMNNGMVVMGSPHASDTGTAYVFKQSGAKWTQFKQLTASDAAAGDQFGAAVAISGGTILVGAPDHSAGEGAAYLFGGASLAPLRKFSSSGASNFGAAVAIDGNRLAVSHLGDEAVDLFTKVEGNWLKSATALGEPMSRFGASVAVSGPYVAVGAYAEFGGRVYILHDDDIFRSGMQ